MTARHPRSGLCALRDLGWSVGGQVVIAFCAFASLRLFTELMSKAEFGRAMIAAGALALLDGLLVMALNQTLLPICAAETAKEGAPAAERLAAQLAFFVWRRVVRAVFPFAIAGAALVLVQGEAQWFAPAFALVYLGEAFVKTAQTSPMAARQAYGALAIWAGCEAIATLSATATILIFWRADAIGYLAGLLVARLLVTGAATALRGAWSALPAARIEPPIDVVTAARAQALPLAALAPLGWTSSFLDRYIIAGAAGVGTAGAYVAAAGLAARPYAMLTAILTQFFRPRLYGGETSPQRTLRLWLGSAMVFGLAGVAAVVWFGDLAINLALAPDFRIGAKPILLTLCIAQSFSIACHALDNALIAGQASAGLLGAQSIGIVAIMILTPLGALHGGGLGAALGRLAAETLKLIAVGWLLARRQAQRKSVRRPLFFFDGATP